MYAYRTTKRISSLNRYGLFAKRYSAKSYISSKAKSLETVDINIIGRCNLACAWCWGPEHNAAEPISFRQWKQTLSNLREYGVNSVVFSGGEPLLKRWIPDLIRFAKEELGLRTTLSTNGILLRHKANRTLPYVDDLGIPIDGSTPEINKIMRIGTVGQFELALDALRFTQKNYPGIELTVRTVVARPNIIDVPLIGKTLLDSDINPALLRWKLYQVNPIGPRKNEILTGKWMISDDEFTEVMKRIKESNPTFKVTGQIINDSVGRYFIIYPDGNSHIIASDDQNRTRDVYLGNIVLEPKRVLDKLDCGTYLENNVRHGKTM